MFRWLLRLVTWSVFLFRLARLPLRLVPTHPDAAGGLGYLEVVHLHFAPLVLAVSAVLARGGVARPDIDVLQLVVRWGGRERALTPISLGASIFQFLLTIVTLPVAKLLPPEVLYRPAMAPSPAALTVSLAAAAGSSALAWLAWSGRVALRAPVEQQREAEAES